MTSKTKPESEDGCRLLLWLVLAWKGSLMPQDMSSEQTYSIQADICWGVRLSCMMVLMTMRPPDVEGEVLCGWQVGVRERQRLCRGNRGPWEDLRCTILYNGWRVGIIIWTPSKGCIHHYYHIHHHVDLAANGPGVTLLCQPCGPRVVIGLGSLLLSYDDRYDDYVGGDVNLLREWSE